MLKLLKKTFTKQRKTTLPIHYDAFGNAIPQVALKQHVKKHLLVVPNNKTPILIEKDTQYTKEQHLAKALSQQMHHALDKMHNQLSERETHMEQRFESLALEQQTILTAPTTKKRLGLYIIGGILAAMTMLYLLNIMQSMQVSMQSMSGDINGMTQDITQMSANTASMSNNMTTMNQGVAGMNQQMEVISDSIEPMGEAAKTVSPFAEMFNSFSPF